MVSQNGAPTPRELMAGQVAAVLVAVEAAVLAWVAGYYVLELLQGEGTDPLIIIMSVVTMLVFVVGLGYVSVGLWRRHPRAQAPAIAVNFLLVPLGIAMFQFAPIWMAAAVLVGAVTVIASSFAMGQPGPPE